MRFRKRGDGAKCSINVEPHLVAPSHVGEIVERIDRAGADRPGVAHDANRPKASALVANNRRLEQTGIELKFLVHWDFPKGSFTQAEKIERFRNRIVRRRRTIDGEARTADSLRADLCAAFHVPRNRKASEVGK